jgi:lipopolysaccharide/colanic/teichoic acid biosynthesis glycosyltransferase
MIKRLFDIVSSVFGIVLLLPVFVFISAWIFIEDGYPVLFFQKRIGKNGKPFSLYKFRTMRKYSEKLGQLTIGDRDPRVTTSGFYLRKYKLDELPQLINVLLGTMSLVGPRPEVERYVLLYSAEQRKVLSVKPGITDLASLMYFKESELLAASSDPETTYIKEIMPEKLKLNLEYIDRSGIATDLIIILKTVARIFR